jgi:hypothetical protein
MLRCLSPPAGCEDKSKVREVSLKGGGEGSADGNSEWRAHLRSDVVYGSVWRWLWLWGHGDNCGGDDGGGSRTERVGARHLGHALQVVATVVTLVQVAAGGVSSYRGGSGGGGLRTYLRDRTKPVARTDGGGWYCAGMAAG